MSAGHTKIPSHSRILQDDRYANVAKLLNELNAKWQPHTGQEFVGQAVFSEGARRIFIECGRKWGKTDFAVDLLWRLGNMINGGQIYYFAAQAKAVRELIWAPKRLESHGPASYITGVHKTEMRVTFKTETFVKLDGADEFKGGKGFNPDVVVLDEFADYPEDFWFAMSPNFASKDTIVIIISSPPWILESEPGTPVLFIRLADLWKRHMEEAARAGKKSKYIYVNQPTKINPHISKEWLAQEKADLIAMGLEDIYLREYEARRVVGGGRRVIATFDREKHLKPHDWMMEKIQKDYDNLSWLDGVDPGSASVFAGLIIAINQWTKEIYFLDEIYEKDESETTEHIIWPKLEAKENELYPIDINPDPERFTRIYDEAAKWWQVGVLNEFGVTFNPTDKATNSIEYGISILRTLFRFDKGYVSERCKWLTWELENYRKDKKGRIPDANNHLIDTSRYLIHADGYFLTPQDREKAEKKHPREQRRELARGGMEEDLEDLASMAHNDPNMFGPPDDGYNDQFDA